MRAPCLTRANDFRCVISYLTRRIYNRLFEPSGGLQRLVGDQVKLDMITLYHDEFETPRKVIFSKLVRVMDQQIFCF